MEKEKKNFLERFRGKQINVNVPISIIMLAASIFLGFYVMHVPIKGEKEVFDIINGYGTNLMWLNIAPVIIVACFLFFTLGRPVFSFAMTIIYFLIMGVVNFYKIGMRQEPFTPTDFGSLVEVKTVIDRFNNFKIFVGVMILVIIALILWWLFLKFKCQKMTKRVRLTGTICVIIAGALCNFGLFRSDDLYNSFPVNGNEYFKVDQYMSRGITYSFAHDLKDLIMGKPEHYEARIYKEAEQNFVPAAYGDDVKKPHIIMVMGESFTDLSDINEHITFEDYPDPMETYKALAASDNAVSGHIVVPSFGGGTADTEYDVLTGLFTRYINSPKASYTFIHKDIDCIPSYLKSMGYHTMATHPGYAWFYNRQNIFSYMGFEEKYFLEDSFDLNTQSINLYITDEATVEFLINKFDQHIAKSDDPLFSFCITIENHGPWTKKYSMENTFNSDITEADVPADNVFGDFNLLSNYFIGIQHMDEALKTLTDHLEESEEPVILVYFGDHLPGFSNGFDIYEDFDYPVKPQGTSEESLRLYETPFLIWENSAAAEMYDLPARAAELGISKDSSIISSSYLGIAMMDMLGFRNLSPYYDYVADSMKTIPMSANSTFITSEGIVHDNQLTEEEHNIVNRLQGWTYYKMFG